DRDTSRRSVCTEHRLQIDLLLMCTIDGFTVCLSQTLVLAEKLHVRPSLFWQCAHVSSVECLDLLFLQLENCAGLYQLIFDELACALCLSVTQLQILLDEEICDFVGHLLRDISLRSDI